MSDVVSLADYRAGASATTDGAAINVSRVFLVAGRARFIAQNPAGITYAYKVVNRPAHSISTSVEQYKPWLLVFVQAPPRGWWHFLGRMNPRDCFLYTTPQSRYDHKSIEVRVFRWAARVILAQQPLPAGYRIVHCGWCGRCSRRLTDPTSLAAGIGPVCRQRQGE